MQSLRSALKVCAAIAAVSAATAGLGACGADQPGQTQSGSTSRPLLTPNVTGSEEPSGDVGTTVECTAKDIKVTGATTEKPQITVPDTCSPPKKLLVQDLTPGTGRKAAAGDTVQTGYVLVTWSDKTELDTSWANGTNTPFPIENLGQAQVIDGWNEGLIGIQPGARRLLVVPPDKGYGNGGQGIKPNETLVFVVDAVKVLPPA